MIKTILWDFDGVIAESVNVKTEAFREIYSQYGVTISDKVVEHHLAHGGVSRFEKFKIYHKDFLGVDLTPNEIQKLALTFSSLVKRKVVEAPYVNGVLEFLESSGDLYSSYIISGTPHDEMVEIVSEKNLKKFFNDVMGSPKSKTDWINKLVEKKTIEIANSVFIGDATTDFIASENTGTKFILRETDDNKKYFEDYAGVRVRDFYQLQSIIEEL